MLKRQIKNHFSLPSPSGRGAGVRVILPLARALRRNPPDAELKIWYLLRDRQLGGYKFRRQFPIGPYIADFCCWKKRLIVELDGGQHAEQADKDAQRTCYLNSQGFRVLRFWDNETLTQTHAVLEKILEALEEPSPCPLPRGEGKKESSILS
ncbi:MAG: endonuclease domain-containing protein [Elusimicrobia bacterium]|nr:endonuclease domain-containing protein [Elusimicrobiota bacterium]